MHEATQVKQTLSPHMMWDLYQKLANDDGFRARLEHRPAEVLAEYGIAAPRQAQDGAFLLPDKSDVADTLKRVSLGSAFVAEGIMGWDAWAVWVFVFLAPAKKEKIEAPGSDTELKA